eukprot:3690916-Pleurochrysis_carterae.AAC.1
MATVAIRTCCHQQAIVGCCGGSHGGSGGADGITRVAFASALILVDHVAQERAAAAAAATQAAQGEAAAKQQERGEGRCPWVALLGKGVSGRGRRPDRPMGRLGAHVGT